MKQLDSLGKPLEFVRTTKQVEQISSNEYISWLGHHLYTIGQKEIWCNHYIRKFKAKTHFKVTHGRQDSWELASAKLNLELDVSFFQEETHQKDSLLGLVEHDYFTISFPMFLELWYIIKMDSRG